MAHCTRLQAAAVGLGLLLAGPQALGVAGADSGGRGDGESPATTDQPQESPSRSGKQSRSGRVPLTQNRPAGNPRAGRSRPGGTEDADPEHSRVNTQSLPDSAQPAESHPAAALQDQRARANAPAKPSAEAAEPLVLDAAPTGTPLKETGPAIAPVDEPASMRTPGGSPTPASAATTLVDISAGPTIIPAAFAPAGAPAAASARAAAVPQVLDTTAVGLAESVSRLVSTLLPNQVGEWLTGSLLLARRSLTRTTPSASATTAALVSGGDDPRPSAAVVPAVAASSAGLNQQGALTVRAGSATTIELRVAAAPAQLSVIERKGNVEQSLGSWLLGSVLSVEFIGSIGDDTFSGGGVLKPMTITGNGGNDTLTGGGDRDVIYGNAGNDVIRGGAGNDTIFGGADNDTLNGEDADDTINGDAGNDFIYGDAGNDTLVDLGGGDDTIAGGDGNDRIQDTGIGRNTLLGGRGVDSITSGDGNDTIRGNEDADTIVAGGGNDTVYGDAGNDTINGGAGVDTIYGGADNDTINGDAGNDTITGEAGNDTVYGGADNDTLYGDLGNDTLNGDAGDDTINGGAGDDRINANGVNIAGLGNDVLRGDAGNDTIKGGDGNDTINGGDDNDIISGDAGNDFLYGEAGNDRLTDFSGDDTIAGGDGDDSIEDSGIGRNTLLGGRGLDTIIAGDGTDTIRGNEDADNILAGGGIDTVYGDAGNDTIQGGAGNDFIYGGADNDTINGGADNDTITGDTGNDTITGEAGNDTLNGADGNDFINGADGNDTINGGAGNDILNGGNGIDTINGDVGNDTIAGEGGIDTLNGGADNDTISGGEGNDTISGGAGNDRANGDAGMDVISGGGGVDFLLGGSDIDTLRGDAGNDTLNGGTGADSLFGGDGDDWLVAIDNLTNDRLQGDAGRDVFWRDRQGGVGDRALDFLATSDFDNFVDQFANGADRTLDGDRIAGPTDPQNNALVDFGSNPLFSSSGPRGTDVIQGPSFLGNFSQKDYTSVGAQLAALARDGDAANSWLIRRAMVDFGDGTYGLNLGGVFYRVDGRLPAANFAGINRPYYANFGAENSIWVAIAEKGLAMALPVSPGVFNYSALKPVVAGGQMSNTYVFSRFGDSQPQSLVGIDVRLGDIAGFTDVLNRFRTGSAYMTVSLADSADSGIGQGGWAAGTLGRKFATFASSGMDFVNGVRMATPMVYTLWAVETSGTQITAVILRNPWGSDTGGLAAPFSYADANPSDGLIRLTIAELASSYRGGQLSWLGR